MPTNCSSIRLSTIDVYCGEEVETFSELCASGVFRIVLQILYTPVVALGSLLTLVTIWFVKKLHTPHDHILFALAVADFAKGVVFSTVHVLSLMPDTHDLIDGQAWTCAMFYNLGWVVYLTSFDMLILMCVDRFFMATKPIWYRYYVTKRRNILIILGLVMFRLIVHFSIQIKNVVDLQDEPWHGCHIDTFVPLSVKVVTTVVFYIEIVLGFVLCISVVVQAWRRHITRRNDKAKTTSSSRTTSSLIRDEDVKANAILVSGLIFTFLILYTPTSLYLIWVRFVRKRDDSCTTLILEDVAFLCRVINAGLNAPILAGTRNVYRQSYKYLLTTPPNKWKYLQRWLNRIEYVCVTSDLIRSETTQERVLHTFLQDTLMLQSTSVDPQDHPSTPAPTPAGSSHISSSLASITSLPQSFLSRAQSVHSAISRKFSKAFTRKSQAPSP